MAITNKYEFETTEGVGTSGWNAIYAANFQKVDNDLHTFIRLPMRSGETIANFDPVSVQQGGFKRAYALTGEPPCVGLAYSGEYFFSGEYMRAQRVGPITNPAWSFVGSGEVYLDASGELVQDFTGSEQKVGFAIDSNIIFLTL